MVKPHKEFSLKKEKNDKLFPEGDMHSLYAKLRGDKRTTGVER